MIGSCAQNHKEADEVVQFIIFEFRAYDFLLLKLSTSDYPKVKTAPKLIHFLYRDKRKRLKT